jgi:hypothetical protein
VHIDLRLDEVVLRTLDSRPERRYQHASDLKTEIESICGISPIARQQIFGKEFRSKTTIAGIPLVHIAFGIDPVTGKKRVAKGIIAIGDIAVGVVAFGGLAVGGIAFGGLAAGLIASGGLAVAILLAIGGLAVGGISFGGMAVGVISLGGGAVGLYAFGGTAFGLHALGGNANDPEAIRFFIPWATDWWKWLAVTSVVSPLLCAAIWLVTWMAFRRQALEVGQPARTM